MDTLPHASGGLSTQGAAPVLHPTWSRRRQGYAQSVIGSLRGQRSVMCFPTT